MYCFIVCIVCYLATSCSWAVRFHRYQKCAWRLGFSHSRNGTSRSTFTAKQQIHRHDSNKYNIIRKSCVLQCMISDMIRVPTSQTNTAELEWHDMHRDRCFNERQEHVNDRRNIAQKSRMEEKMTRNPVNSMSEKRRLRLKMIAYLLMVATLLFRWYNTRLCYAYSDRKRTESLQF